MGALMMLVGFSLLIALGFFTAFLWAVRSGQFDDPVTPSFRFLADDEPEPIDQINHMETKNNE